MLYLLTSNDDRKTSSRNTMWTLRTQHPCIIYVNFRSEQHVHNGSSHVWLASAAWTLEDNMTSATSSGSEDKSLSNRMRLLTLEPHACIHIGMCMHAQSNQPGSPSASFPCDATAVAVSGRCRSLLTMGGV